MKSLILSILSLQVFAAPSYAATLVYVKAERAMADWKAKEEGRTLIRMYNTGEEKWVDNSEISFEVKKGKFVGFVTQGSFVMALMQSNVIAQNPTKFEWVDGQVMYLFEDGTALLRTNRGNFYVNVITDRSKLSFTVDRKPEEVAQIYTLKEPAGIGWEAGHKVMISRLYDNGIAGIIGAWFFAKSRVKISAVDNYVPLSNLCLNSCQ